MPRPRRRRRWSLLALATAATASLPPLPKDQPPNVKSDTADLTVLQDDGVEVFDTVDIDEVGAGLYPALPFSESSPDDTAVTIYRPRKDSQVPTNWTVDALEELVTRTPFLSSEGTVVFTGKLLSDVVSDETNCPQGIICAAQDDNSKALIERRTWTLEALDRASGELLWRATASRLGDQVGTNTSSAVAKPRRPLFATVTETAAAVAACTLAAMNQDATALVPLNAQPAIFCPPPSRFFSLTAVLMLLSAAVAMSYGLSYARKNTVQRVPRIVADKRGSGFFGTKRVDVHQKPAEDRLQLAQEIAALQRADHAAVLRFYACDVLPCGVAQIAVEASLCTLEEALATHNCVGLPSELQLSLRSIAEALSWLREALPDSKRRWRATPDRIVLVPRSTSGSLWAAHELKLVPRDGDNKGDDVADLKRLALLCAGESDDARCLEMRDLGPCATPIQWSKHPALWDESRRVAFLLDASDYAEETSEADALRAAIDASNGFDDWRAAFSDDFLRHAEARRTYDGHSVRALLRMLRNQSHHIHTSPFAELRTREGLLAFVLMRFPCLLLRVFEACHAALPATADLRSYLGYFGAPALERAPSAPALVAAAATRTAAEAPALVAAAEAPNSRGEGPSGSSATREAAEALTMDEAPTAAPSRRGSPASDEDDLNARLATLAVADPPAAQKGSPRGVQEPLPKGYRTRLCKHWLASGGTHCPMKARGLPCKFAHGEHELRPPEEGFAPPPEAKKRRPRRKSSSPRPAAANIPS
jgi:hypothetical protein